MADERRDEIEQLRTTLSEVSEVLRRLDDRLRRLEGAAGPGPASHEPLPEAEPLVKPPDRGRVDTARGAPPLRPTYKPPTERRPREPGRIERHVREFFTQGNPLNKLGALVLITAAVLFFKYAVDNRWIGPTGRVGIGIVTGALLFSVGEYYARKGWRIFASGLVGAGNGVLFVAVFFGHQQYEIIPAVLAFGLYVLVTAAVVAQSLRYGAVGLAVWGLLGGYLTPWLASTGTGNFVFLSCYLLVLNTGVFAIAYHRTWQPLKWMAFLLTEPYLFIWVQTFLNNPHANRWLEYHWLLPFLWIFFIYFAAIPTWRSLINREPIDRFGQALTVLNGVVHFGYAAMLLYEDHRIWLGLVAVVVTAIYAVISSLVVRQPVVDAKGLRVFTGTAAGFLLLATPFLVKGSAITLIWCVETVFIAWACTQPRFSFLRLHVVAMLAIILMRLVEWDGLFYHVAPDPQRWYIPFAQLRSYPPFAAAVTFAIVGRLFRRVPNMRLPLSWILGAAVLVLIAAVDAEAFRLARYTLAPHASHALHDLIEAGLLVAIMSGLWFGVVLPFGHGDLPWLAVAAFTAVLSLWVLDELLWVGSYSGMVRILGDGFGLAWLHVSVLLMLPLLLLYRSLLRETPDGGQGLRRDQLQAACFGFAILIVMFLLRREIFAITHAPPIADFFPETARRDSYNMLLSISYAALAFGVYLNALKQEGRARLFTAYALYGFTTIKVYFYDLGGRNMLYLVGSLTVLGAILLISSYVATRVRNRYA